MTTITTTRTIIASADQDLPATVRALRMLGMPTHRVVATLHRCGSPLGRILEALDLKDADAVRVCRRAGLSHTAISSALALPSEEYIRMLLAAAGGGRKAARAAWTAALEIIGGRYRAVEAMLAAGLDPCATAAVARPAMRNDDHLALALHKAGIDAYALARTLRAAGLSIRGVALAMASTGIQRGYVAAALWSRRGLGLALVRVASVMGVDADDVVDRISDGTGLDPAIVRRAVERARARRPAR